MYVREMIILKYYRYRNHYSIGMKYNKAFGYSNQREANIFRKMIYISVDLSKVKTERDVWRTKDRFLSLSHDKIYFSGSSDWSDWSVKQQGRM